MADGGRPIWFPSDARIAASAMQAFSVDAGRRFGVSPGAEALHRWSVERPEEFWPLVWERCGVVGDTGPEPMRRGDSFPATRFFPSASLSVVENLLKTRGSGEALVALDEDGNRRSRTWGELCDRVARLAGALSAAGVGPGDRVAAWLPNSLEAVETMLAAASLGAVFSSTSPDFGASGVLDRFGQIEPTVLVAVDGYRYGGKSFDCTERLAQIVAGLPTLRATVVVRSSGAPLPGGCTSYEEFLASGPAVVPRRFAFDHPWYVLYSSGTTGVPKCIVHRTGGVLLQHVKEHQLHCDVRAGDRV
ncbi:MAG: acetoacetate--CoA ligase, partial [Actinobacteria bacterium]|nr:acetoacetate--CoA ligase [Actinomycetota bacterium]